MDPSGISPSAPPDAGNVGPKTNLLFSEQSIRSRFVKKVFILVTIMFAIVAMMCAMPYIFPSFKMWVQTNMAFFFVSM
ncbi:hypothetical protein ANCCAN_13947 [Ancylostoma caninum]|uniref:Uncharacterized protein n=1 Tax=Ancylostoma caninum TaxID=29170 RepID=A0A368G6X9_ANCCA|nr:hypothetical protein ANCCAN_13947 [Ancylostoma caninum]